MAIAYCKECGNEVSARSTRCMRCGYSPADFGETCGSCDKFTYGDCNYCDTSSSRKACPAWREREFFDYD